MQINSHEPSLFWLSFQNREVGGSKLISNKYEKVFTLYTGRKIISGKHADIHTELNICCFQERQFRLLMEIKRFTFSLNSQKFIWATRLHLRFCWSIAFRCLFFVPFKQLFYLMNERVYIFKC